jgi:PAS domain S-box-containing protein
MHRTATSLAHTRILVVEDEPACRDAVKTFLESDGAYVIPVASAEDAVAQLAADPFDVVITDIHLDGMDGIELLKQIRETGNDIPVLIITGFASIESAISALQLGADDYLIKPLTKSEIIVRATRNAISAYHLRAQNVILRSQLAESELSFQTVFDHTADMIFSFTLAADGQPMAFEQTSLSAVNCLGYPETTLRRMHMLDVIAKTHKEDTLSRLSSLNPLQSESFDTVLLSADGKRIPVELNCHLLQSPERRLVIAIARNASDRVEIEAKFANMLEEERSRMGRELHDTVCQDLTSIDILTKALSTSDSSNDIDALRSAAASALDTTRQLCKGLIPTFNDTSEFNLAVEELLETHKSRHGIDYSLNMGPAATVDGFNGLLHLFRIIQEATNNTVKHGKAKHITVTITCDSDTCRLTVSDDGQGLTAEHSPNDGMGMLIMRQRARILGASLSVSNNGNGTTVECCWQHGDTDNA